MASEDDERTPCTIAQPYAPSKLTILALCCILIIFSVSLINFNNWLMEPGRFPYSLPLVLVHMCFCSVMALCLLVLKPSLFPAFTDPDTRIEFDMQFYLKGCLPIALVFGLSLVLGNIVYKYLGMAFIQMIKESNLIFVCILTCICGMERVSIRTIQVICLALCGMSLAIKGEMKFSMIGFVIQLSAVLCEAVRITMQGGLLQGKKMDPLSYVLVMSPSCGALLLCTLLLLLSMPPGVAGPDLAVPPMSLVVEWAPWLVADSILAFSLNVCIALVIKYTGPMSYIMCGIAKDLAAVLVSMVFLQETVSAMQALGFIMQIFAVLIWALLKCNPAKFESGIIVGLQSSLKAST